MASQPRPPATTTTSTCTPHTSRGRHVFQIDGYSLHRDVGGFVQSAAFTVGGYSWCVRCYPDGASKDSRGHVSVFLRLVTRNAKARARYEIRLVGRRTGPSSPAPAPRTSGRRLFDTTNSGEAVWGRILFIKASELEASAAEFLRGDRLVIECDVTVIGEPLVTEAAAKAVEVRVPPSDLAGDFGRLLESGEGADMVFEVEDEYFFAHRVVLGARSPVLCAELCGTTKVGEHHDRGCIAVAGMKPPIFRALLRFIYTDSLPAIDDDLGVNEVHDMARNLFVAADKYAMERLKVVCTGILCRCLDDATVDSALALAEQYDCSVLRDVCIEHINDSSSRKGDQHAAAGQQAYYHRRIARAKPSIWVVYLWEKIRSLFRFK